MSAGVHRLAIGEGRDLEVRADVGPDVIAWLAARIAAGPEPITEGRGIEIGSMLCTTRSEGGALVLDAPDLATVPPDDVPWPSTDDTTRALALGFEQDRVAQSFELELHRDVIHSMSITTWPGWDTRGYYRAWRDDRALGSDSGWRVWSGPSPRGEPRQRTVAELIAKRPALARFLAFPRGTTLAYTHGVLQVTIEDRSREPVPGSWLATRRAISPDAIDPAWVEEAVRQWRATSPSAAHPPMHLGDGIAEQLLVESDIAAAIVARAHDRLAREGAYDRAFVRKLSTWLRQGREAVAIAQLVEIARVTPEGARRFLERHRASIEAAKVPPRSDDDFG